MNSIINILAVGFTGEYKEILDKLSSDKGFGITHVRTAKNALETISSSGKIFDKLFIKVGLWPDKAGRSAIKSKELFGCMANIPALVEEALEVKMAIGIALPAFGAKAIVHNLNDLDDIEGIKDLVAINVTTNEELTGLFETVSSLTAATSPDASIGDLEKSKEEDSAEKTEEADKQTAPTT